MCLVMIALKITWLCPGALPWSTSRSDSISSSCMCLLSEVLQNARLDILHDFRLPIGLLPFALPRPFDTLPCPFLPLGGEEDAWGAGRDHLWEDGERVTVLDYSPWGWGEDWLLPYYPICLHSLHFRRHITVGS